MIIEATRDHAMAILADVRPEVAAEGLATADISLEALMDRTLLHSVRAWVWIPDDGPVAIWGVATDSPISNVGRPWLVTTRGVDAHKIYFARASQRWVRLMRGMFPVLENWVDARYIKCVKWLKWLGFTISDPEPFGHMQVPFHKFRMG